ncbi:DUF7310 family coiled-coil domain-containing protein [Halobacterium yunchengense]|uniref:DUF7310 family coiled-coil domain-containing protein n=1 Tax=Halobacterium yunchengense TaxID=3108497 RepID=UPI003009E409
MPEDGADPRLDDLSERLRAVERAVTDGDTAVAELADAAAVHGRLEDLRSDVDELGERLDAVEATVQSLHGYVGELDAVNDRVERRADAARAAVDRLEARSQFAAPTDEPGATGSSEPQRRGPPAADVAAGAADDVLAGAAGDAPSTDSPPTGQSTDRRAGDRSDRTGDESLLDRLRESL